MNVPDPRKAIRVGRKARYVPGIKVCKKQMARQNSVENSSFGKPHNRTLRDELKGTRPINTTDGRVYRPTGKWVDSPGTKGHYFTSNKTVFSDLPKTVAYIKRVTIKYINGKQDVVLEGKIKVVDIGYENVNDKKIQRGWIKTKGHNVKVYQINGEWYTLA